MLRRGKGYLADRVIISVRHIDVSRAVTRYAAGTVKSRIRAHIAGASRSRAGGHHSQWGDFSDCIVAGVRHIDIPLVVNRQTLGIRELRVMAVDVGVSRIAGK